MIGIRRHADHRKYPERTKVRRELLFFTEGYSQRVAGDIDAARSIPKKARVPVPVPAPSSRCVSFLRKPSVERGLARCGKSIRIGLLQNRDCAGSFIEADDAAAIFRERQARSVGLPFTGLTAQLQYKLMNHRKTCGSNRMSF